MIKAGGDGNFGQNSFFYDAAEGLLASAILLVAEFCPPETQHIGSVFNIIQGMLVPDMTGQPRFLSLFRKLPPEHKAVQLAASALNSSEQAISSVLSTAMSRLISFLDSEMEQLLCFDTDIDAETFCSQKSAVFVVLPEEDTSKYFFVSLLIQELYRELLMLADEQGGKLQRRVVFFCDELGTLPKIESLELIFSAARSRGLLMVPIIQSPLQLQRNYGKEGAAIITENCQDVIFGGFAPMSSTAEEISKAMGTRTVLTGSVSKGQKESSASRSLQMTSRALMSPDELRNLPRGQFILLKTGHHPMQMRLRLFLEWGISFEGEYLPEERTVQKVAYADCEMLERAITKSRMHGVKGQRSVDLSEEGVGEDGIPVVGVP